MKMQSKKRAIDKIFKRRDRYEIPDWQRQEVWGQSKKQNLIDTVLRGWKLPKFYFLRVTEEPESFEVVDGQQRLVTIWHFFENQLPLSEKTANDFGGRLYKDLRDAVADAFDDYEIEYDEITQATEEEVKQFFQRLQEGVRLTSAEKLNSVHSNLRDFIQDATGHPFLKKISASNARYGHFDIIAKVAAIEIDGIGVGLRYDDLRAVLESQSEFSPASNLADRIQSALAFADAGFDDKTALSLRNRTIVQSLLTLICRLLASGKAVGQEGRICQFFLSFLEELNRQVELGQEATDSDYLEFQRTVNANIRDGARIRQEILLRKLLASDPSVADLLDPAALVESGLRAAISADAGQITALIAQRNQEYSAKNGEDLFKPTNRTVQAQANLGKPIINFHEYESFIGDAYFIFRESVGTRLDTRAPDSFKDVNTLRTDLQHDVDHGDPQKVKSKRKKIGKTFAKYSGAPSPESLAPERFIVVQANLLRALRHDLTLLVP